LIISLEKLEEFSDEEKKDLFRILLAFRFWDNLKDMKDVKVTKNINYNYNNEYRQFYKLYEKFNKNFRLNFQKDRELAVSAYLELILECRNGLRESDIENLRFRLNCLTDSEKDRVIDLKKCLDQHIKRPFLIVKSHEFAFKMADKKTSNDLFFGYIEFAIHSYLNYVKKRSFSDVCASRYNNKETSNEWDWYHAFKNFNLIHEWNNLVNIYQLDPALYSNSPKLDLKAILNDRLLCKNFETDIGYTSLRAFLCHYVKHYHELNKALSANEKQVIEASAQHLDHISEEERKIRNKFYHFIKFVPYFIRKNFGELKLENYSTQVTPYKIFKITSNIKKNHGMIILIQDYTNETNIATFNANRKQ
jgi:hypothetical protein